MSTGAASATLPVAGVGPAAPTAPVGPVAPVSRVAPVVARGDDVHAATTALPSRSVQTDLSAEALRFSEILAKIPAATTTLVRGLGIAPTLTMPGYLVPASRTPLVLPNAEVDVDGIETTLRQRLSQSGLFYESHLRNAESSHTPWESLAAEPQNRQPSEATLHRLVAQQLDLQLLGRLSVTTEAWPGVPVQWVMEEDARHGDHSETSANIKDEGAPRWRSLLRILLPHLGEIQAEIIADHGRLTLQLQTMDAGSAEVLRNALPDFRGNLDAAGLLTDRVDVANNRESPHEPAP